MDYQTARAGLIKGLEGSIKDKRVLDVMSRIPRELFVPEASRQLAYEDQPLPIGFQQTISQPYIIALMTEALELSPDDVVLEVGTGSGYQAAILAEICRRVVSVERQPGLAAPAKKILSSLGYKNIELHPADETLGWKAGAPYNAIIVTAGAPRVPEELLDQLAVNGRLVIPVGTRYVQELCKVTRRPYKNTVQNLGGCRFVSLIGRSAWKE